MNHFIYFSVIYLWAFSPAFAQHPFKDVTDAVTLRYAQSQPVIGYTLSVETTDLSIFNVDMRIRNVRDTFRVGMVAHPEYDDHFWRYVEDIRVESKTKGTLLREDSALWRIAAPGGEVVLHYKIHLPAPQPGPRAAWRPFLSPDGGLIGGPHSFMYVIGATLAPSYVTVKIPSGWKVVTGLEQTADASTFFAPSVFVLIDSPILVGHFKNWMFAIDQVPHRVVYWSLPNAVLFDTARFVTHIQQFVQQAKTLFGRLPYRDYSFLFQDGAYGALEHSNSMTIGVSGNELSKNVSAYLGEITHEYFHTWNLMRIHPVEYGDVSYKTPPLSRGLWWSEGLTMFYADLLSRRAGIPTYDSSRIKHLERLIGRYFGSPGNAKISPEQASLASYGPPGMLGDYSASPHLQGELLGTLLDLIIGDATQGKKSMDDLMQTMMKDFSGPKGFIGKDIEQMIQKISGRNVHPFFEEYIYGNKSMDFNAYLKLAGLRMDITWGAAADVNHKPYADLRAYTFLSDDRKVKLGITDPSGCWARAGLHTGDVIVAVNKIAVKNINDFRQEIRKAQVGDTVSVEIQRPTGIVKTMVIITGYKQPSVRIEELKETTLQQQRLREAWMSN